MIVAIDPHRKVSLDDKYAFIGVAIAEIPEQIRGHGHVKEKAIATARAKEQELFNQFRLNDNPALVAA